MSDNYALIAEFKTKLAESQGLYDQQMPPRRALNDEFTRTIETEWKKTQGRKKFSMNKAAETLPNFAALKEPFEQRGKELSAIQAAERQAVKQSLEKLAGKIEITEDLKLIEANKTNWSLYDSRSTADYSTQGFGAEKYARESARNILDHLEACGVSGEIREDRREPIVASGWSMSSVTFQVYAGIDATMCEVVRRKPGISLVEWVRRQWARGVNPRVSNPFIPAGFEEKHGLDYFGGYVKKKGVTA